MWGCVTIKITNMLILFMQSAIRTPYKIYKSLSNIHFNTTSLNKTKKLLQITNVIYKWLE